MSLVARAVGVDPDRGHYVIVRTARDIAPRSEQLCSVLDARSRRAFFITISTDLAKASELGPQGQKLWLPLNVKDKGQSDAKSTVLLKVDRCWSQLLHNLRSLTLERAVNFFADNPVFYEFAHRNAAIDEARAQPVARPVVVRRVFDRDALFQQARVQVQKRHVARVQPGMVRADLKPQHTPPDQPMKMAKEAGPVRALYRPVAKGAGIKKVEPKKARDPSPVRAEPKKEEGKRAREVSPPRAEPQKTTLKASSSVPTLPVAKAAASVAARSLSPAPNATNSTTLQRLGDLSSRSSAERVLTYLTDNGSTLVARLTRQNSSVTIPPRDSGLSRTLVVHKRQDSQDRTVRRPHFYMTSTQLGDGGFKNVLNLVDVSTLTMLASLRPRQFDRQALLMQQKELRILTKLKTKRGVAQLKDSIAHRTSTVIGGYRTNKVQWLELLLIKYAKGNLWTYLTSTTVSRQIRLQLAYDIACGVAAAHAEGIVHRDLKPDNVLIGEDPSGAVFAAVTDFGISVEGHPRFPVRVSNCQGTRGYIAPEVRKLLISRSQVDGKAADIWSLGQLFYDLFTRGTGGIDIRADVANRGALSQLVVGMIRTKPQNRLTIEGVLKMLHGIIESERTPHVASTATTSLSSTPLPRGVGATVVVASPAAAS